MIAEGSARSARLPTGIGAVIMAGGIFGAAALQRIPGAGALLTTPLSIALAIGWAGVAASALRDGMADHTGPLVGSFAIGTWTAASVVVARMAMLAAPALLWPAELLFAVSLGLWAWFVPRAIGNLVRIARSPAASTRPTGAILLTTVATQAVALLGFRLFADVWQMRWLGFALLAFGAGCYVVGTGLIARRYAAGGAWRLAADWDNTNCILHGALSISGLAAVVGEGFGIAPIAWLWVLTAAVFLAVEAIEIARLGARVRVLGWRGAVIVYDTSQWARNFTFGMFYAFTVAVAGRLDVDGGYPEPARVAAAIAGGGQYLVLALLAVELALMGCWLAGRLERQLHPAR